VETFNNGRQRLRAAVSLHMYVEVRQRGLGLLWPRLNADPVCDDSAAEGSICANVALYHHHHSFITQKVTHKANKLYTGWPKK